MIDLQSIDLTRRHNSKYSIILIPLLIFFSICLIVAFLKINENSGITLSLFVIMATALALKWDADIRFVWVGISFFLIFKLYSLYNIDPITGPDSVRYFALTQNFSDLRAFYDFALNEISSFGLFGISSITFYGLFYMPYYVFFALKTPVAIVVFNTIFMVATIYLWSKTFVSFRGEITTKQKKLFISSLVLLAFFSPSLSYWSSVFLKDVFSLFLGVLSFYLLQKRKLLYFFIVLILAIAIRPYAIGFVFCFWAIFYLRNKFTFLASILAAIYVVYKAGLTGFINTFPMILRILFSPNPSKLDNWSNFFLPTFEGFVIILGLLLVFISFLRNKASRKVYIAFFMSLFIYACILTLVGQTSMLSKDLDYGLLSAGDDMFRKKLPFILIIYTVISYAIATSKTRLTLK